MNLPANQQQAIDSAEGMQRMTAASIFEQLGQVAPISGVAHGIHPAYENSTAQVFEIGRTLSRSAGELTGAALGRIGM